MATNYYNVEMGVVDASGNLNVIYPVTTANNVAVGTNETLASRLNTINSNINALNTLIHDISSEFTGSISGGFQNITATLTFSSASRIITLFGSYGLLAIYIIAKEGSSTTLCTYRHNHSMYEFSPNKLGDSENFGVNPSYISSNTLICKGTGGNGSYTYLSGHGFIIRAK